MAEIKVGDICPKCGQKITSISHKVIKGRVYLYVYHGRASCYLGPAGASPNASTPAGPAPRPRIKNPANRSRIMAPKTDSLRLDEIVEKITEKVVERVREAIQYGQPNAIVRTVTPNDRSRTRGKVYVPGGWIGKKVRVELIE